jgi:hypothetical protein
MKPLVQEAVITKLRRLQRKLVRLDVQILDINIALDSRKSMVFKLNGKLAQLHEKSISKNLSQYKSLRNTVRVEMLVRRLTGVNADRCDMLKLQLRKRICKSVTCQKKIDIQTDIWANTRRMDLERSDGPSVCTWNMLEQFFLLLFDPMDRPNFDSAVHFCRTSRVHRQTTRDYFIEHPFFFPCIPTLPNVAYITGDIKKSRCGHWFAIYQHDNERKTLTHTRFKVDDSSNEFGFTDHFRVNLVALQDDPHKQRIIFQKVFSDEEQNPQIWTVGGRWNMNEYGDVNNWRALPISKCCIDPAFKPLDNMDYGIKTRHRYDLSEVSMYTCSQSRPDDWIKLGFVVDDVEGSSTLMLSDT